MMWPGAKGLDATRLSTYRKAAKRKGVMERLAMVRVSDQPRLEPESRPERRPMTARMSRAAPRKSTRAIFSRQWE